MRLTPDYVEWGAELATSEQPGPCRTCEPGDPFADRAVRERTAELIVRAVLGKKFRASESLN
jgi:hypothetical protein